MDQSCTVYKTMEYLSKKWTVLILLELYKRSGGGTEWKRFSDLMRSMKSVTPKVLSERLKELTEEGLVENRVDASSFPVKSEYRMTEAGRELMDAVHEIKRWALKWKICNEACKRQNCMVCIL
ncbi:MAG: helix-turn-helix transcriptional regulator [Candidatus Methanomethylophilus sp.]|jgi:DNA-binding HxlR family transcriptional regulator|nr:helix-turn-helix transcriptional regulator [Methanomethylophilus sp.]MCI2075553.1 helix-turn-helix transcriptional regulator [Methanomethylophilus sp.]MCI2093849.1 helix-turn-helix transcriptional regulator [Methanomethylophilus sp.]